MGLTLYLYQALNMARLNIAASPPLGRYLVPGHSAPSSWVGFVFCVTQLVWVIRCLKHRLWWSIGMKYNLSYNGNYSYESQMTARAFSHSESLWFRKKILEKQYLWTYKFVGSYRSHTWLCLYMYPTRACLRRRYPVLEIHSIHRAVVTVVTFVLATTSMFQSGFGERQQAVEQMQQKKKKKKILQSNCAD